MLLRTDLEVLNKFYNIISNLSNIQKNIDYKPHKTPTFHLVASAMHFHSIKVSSENPMDNNKVPYNHIDFVLRKWSNSICFKWVKPWELPQLKIDNSWLDNDKDKTWKLIHSNLQSFPRRMKLWLLFIETFGVVEDCVNIYNHQVSL